MPTRCKSADNPTPYERVVTSVGPTYAMDRLVGDVSRCVRTRTSMRSATACSTAGSTTASTATEVTREEGAKKSSIYTAHAGIVTRGVLMDIPALKGVPYLEPGTRIFVEDLEAWERRAGVKVAAGDALFIRTGRWVRAKTGATRQQRHVGTGCLGHSMVEASRRRGRGERVRARRAAIERASRPGRSRLRARVPRHPRHRQLRFDGARRSGERAEALVVPIRRGTAADPHRHRLAAQSARDFLRKGGS